MPLPRVLVIDDLYGRQNPSGRNRERADLCAQYLLKDVTGDEERLPKPQVIRDPIAEAVFLRGQRPARALLGDVVENDPEGVLERLDGTWNRVPDSTRTWSLVLLDLCFYTGAVTEESHARAAGTPEGRLGDDRPETYFGLRLLGLLRVQFPDLPVVILSSMARQEVSLEFAQLGALGFLERDSENGPELLRDYLNRHGLLPDESGQIAGTSRPLLFALREARRAARHAWPVLLRGERGTGKELFAGYMHRNGDETGRRPFVVVNSGGLSPELYLSELFGHRKGSFTGADRNRAGAIERADGGDLFLDEIGNMPPDVQAGLLRVIEDKRLVVLGSSEARPVDIRIIAATNADLEAKASAGNFYPDLLDRLGNSRAIWLPPLRERRSDIPLLAEHFVRIAEDTVAGAMRRFVTPSALDRLRAWDWPGNIREFRDVIFQAVSSHPDVENLVDAHLSLQAIRQKSKQTRDPADSPQVPAAPAADLDALIESLERFDFENLQPRSYAGRLPRLQRALATLNARYLKTALESTRRRTATNPEGEILLHPAIKLITGDPDISASRASDVIKRMLKSDKEILRQLLEDSALQEAWEKASRLRPSR